jgi:hypothetical protein
VVAASSGEAAEIVALATHANFFARGSIAVAVADAGVAVLTEAAPCGGGAYVIDDVSAVGEVKSVLTVAELDDYLGRLHSSSDCARPSGLQTGCWIQRWTVRLPKQPPCQSFS